MSTSLNLKGKPAGASTTPGRFQKLNFHNAPAPMEFAVRIGASTEDVVFRGDVDAPTLQGLLEACSGLAGFSVDVFGGTVQTGTGADGAARHSGGFIVVLHGAAPYPAWGAVQNAEVQRLAIEEGDDGNYTWNGGGNFTAGVSEADLQTNQRALGGDYASVVVKGHSAAAGYADVEVSGSTNDSAGADENGTYVHSGTFYNGRPVWNKETVRTIVWDSSNSFWRLSIYGDGTNPSGSRWANDGGDIDGWAGSWTYLGGSSGTLVVSPLEATPANGDFHSYFPFSSGDAANPSATGTDAVASTLYHGGSASELVTCESADIESLLIAGLQNPVASAAPAEFTPDPAHWYAPAPATPQEALDRMAAAFTNWWAYPIPNQT